MVLVCLPEDRLMWAWAPLAERLTPGSTVLPCPLASMDEERVCSSNVLLVDLRLGGTPVLGCPWVVAMVKPNGFLPDFEGYAMASSM